MLEPPLGVTNPFWVCVNCGVILPSPHKTASKHFDTSPDAWGHWLYEFSFTEGRYPYFPTGWEIHTSDGGGYYRTRHPVAEVFERFARSFVNKILNEVRVNTRIDFLHGPGASAAIDRAYADGSIFSDGGDTSAYGEY